MRKLDMSKPLKVKAIYLKGNNRPLQDRCVFVAGNFLIVGKDEEDTAPTWYNMNSIHKLEGVEYLNPPRTGREVEL